jgi:ParB-like chromosome segregation protein Spo0J
MQEPVEPFVSLKFVSVESLVPYARNARTHSASQVAQLAASIVEWGWTNPILADDRGVVAGHGRLEAARLLYAQGKVLRLPNGEQIPSGEVPVLDVSGWPESKRRAYVLADNKLALGSGWDEGMLAEELRSLTEDGFDLSLAGFENLPAEAPKFESSSDKPIEDFPSFDEDIDTAHTCPKCGYAWS